jgi:uncharacterized protein YuzE
MRKIKYSKDVEALLIELSDKKIDYAEEEGQIIIHFSKDGEPVFFWNYLMQKTSCSILSPAL